LLYNLLESRLLETIEEKSIFACTKVQVFYNPLNLNLMTQLFKKDSKGKIRVWKISTTGDEIIEQYGLIDGKHAESRKTATPKNVGRANETTGTEQAVLQMNSKITEKLKEDYFRTQEEAENTTVILPMLAKSFDKEVKKVEYPCFVQPKLDGMRALYSKRSLTSRTGGKIETMDHIVNDIMDSTHQILDGELYAHEISFQENMKLIKKYRGEESESVKFHVYDLVSDEPFFTRYKRLAEIVEDYDTVEIVPTYLINSKEELDHYHAKFLNDGYEGSIVRWGTAGYKLNGRSSNLLKYKDFKDLACKIVGLVPMEARPDQAVVVCEHNGKSFKATPKMSHTARRELLLDHSIIGQTAEIRYFEETDDGLPRFPVFIGVRLDK